MMTEIHAQVGTAEVSRFFKRFNSNLFPYLQPAKCGAGAAGDAKDDDGPSTKKHAGLDKKLQDKKKEKLLKEKKRMLKRL